MAQIVTIGLDLAKNVFQVHGVDAAGAVVVRRQLRRAPMCSNSSPRSPRAWWAWRPAPQGAIGAAS